MDRARRHYCLEGGSARSFTRSAYGSSAGHRGEGNVWYQYAVAQTSCGDSKFSHVLSSAAEALAGGSKRWWLRTSSGQRSFGSARSWATLPPAICCRVTRTAFVK